MIYGENFLKNLVQYVDSYKRTLIHNHDLFEIYEGDLCKYLDESMRAQFSAQFYDQVKHRSAPINILKKVIDKLSTIYGEPPRRIMEGSTGDEAIWDWYQENLDPDPYMNHANEFYNLFKSCLIEPYVDKGVPRLRIIPSDRFIPYSDNRVNPMEPTHIVIDAGERMNGSQMEQIYRVYSDDSFAIINGRGEVLQDEMMALDNVEGINPYGKLPFVYVNKSANMLVPLIDGDLKKMSIVIPLILSDLNAAVMFQSFSIIYARNISREGELKMAPNAIWFLKSDMDGEQQADVGTLKPDVDIEPVINMIGQEMALWLNTRGIRPGAIGGLSAETFSSGISKMIDEADTYDDRKKQVTKFQAAEEQLWDLITHYMHPVWVKTRQLEGMTAVFSATSKINVDFPEQVPSMNRAELVSSLVDEVSAGFTTRKRAIKVLNPRMTDQEIDELIAEIEGPEMAEPAPEPTPPMDDEENGADQDDNTDT